MPALGTQHIRTLEGNILEFQIPTPSNELPTTSLSATDGVDSVNPATTLLLPLGSLGNTGNGVAAIMLAVLRQALIMTPADVKALYTTPLEVVPAPGPGRMLMPLTAVLSLTFASTPYVATGPVELGWAGSGGDRPEPCAVQLDILGASSSGIVVGGGANQSDTRALFENRGLVLFNRILDPTAGDSPIAATVVYAVIGI